MFLASIRGLRVDESNLVVKHLEVGDGAGGEPGFDVLRLALEQRDTLLLDLDMLSIDEHGVKFFADIEQRVIDNQL